MTEWKPITDLPVNWRDLSHIHLKNLAETWQERRKALEDTQTLKLFLDKLRRRIAIETGFIERLYTIDRGVTRLLIEYGIDVTLIPHGKTDKSPQEVVTFIRDHEAAIERVFDLVGTEKRQLSTSFIKQLHQLLTRHQPYTDAVDQFGNLGKVELLRGDWKKTPNNPTRRDGTIHHYCPPEQVAAQMDQLIAWHLEHLKFEDYSPEVEAAWLHHRFTQIHPFQDGNGRVARNLATLVFIQVGWFPLSVLKEDMDENQARVQYIDALEKADDGDLQPLVDLFATAQQQAFYTSLSLSEEVLTEQESVQAILGAAFAKIERKQDLFNEQASVKAQNYAAALFDSVQQRLSRLADDFKRDTVSTLVDSAPYEDVRASFYRYQIVEIAKALRYYANLNGYKSWLRLSIRYDDTQTELLFSLHGLGREPRGVMVCTACAFRRSSVDEDKPSQVQSLEPLSPLPFDFTYKEDLRDIQKRFDKWLENVVKQGVLYWSRGI